MAAALERLGFEAEIVAERGLIGKALGEKVHAHLTSANPDDLLVVHVLGHGLLTREGATVYVLGEDGVEHELADAAQWVSSTQTLPGRPQTLFLLDLCSSGVLARLPWQQAVSASTNRAWVVAACSP